MTLLKHVSEYRPDIILAALEGSDLGVAIVEGDERVLYLNQRARRLLGCETPGTPPEWVRAALRPLLERIWDTGTHLVDRWVHNDLTLRVHARPVDRVRAIAALEITVSHEGTLSQPLAHVLGLSVPEARLLSFVWRGMSNEEIANLLGVRLGTVKSRLFRLYQKLGVKNRATAVLRATEILQPAA